MKHRLLHSHDLAQRLDDYARRLGCDAADLRQAWDWMLRHDVAFEEPRRDGRVRTFISYLDVEKRIEHPLARRFYALLKSEVGTGFVPLYGLNWPTLVDRWRRGWELLYNSLINRIPSHTIRLAWLRIGGAKIGRGSTLWRYTEVLGVEGLRIGEDTCIGWHCQIDARAGLTIGNHVTVASHVIMIAGGHDLQAPEFWAVGLPIRIDDYAWITTRSVLLAGAEIGRGAVVSAGTVVSKPVAPCTIVGGADARVLGERCTEFNYKVGGKGLFTLFH